MKGLIIKERWLELILDGEKTWEIRGSNTKNFGEIALIKSGTGKIFGTAVLTRSFRTTFEALEQGREHHRIPSRVIIPYIKPYVWELTAAKRFEQPIPYVHPQGAVIWVNLG